MCKAEGSRFNLVKCRISAFLPGILPIDSMVSATQRHKVIPYFSMAVNRLPATHHYCGCYTF